MRNHHTAAKVMLVGFPHRQQTLFAQLFKQPNFQAFTLVDQAPIDVAIVDLDAPQAEENWKVFRRNFPQTPAITVSLTPKEQKGPYWLAKPVNLHALKSLLASLNPHGTTQQPSSSTLIDTKRSHISAMLKNGAEPTQQKYSSTNELSFHLTTANSSYQVNDYLEGKLKNAILKTKKRHTAQKLIGHLQGAPLPGDLYILPDCHSIVTDIKPRFLRALSLINLSQEKAVFEFAPFNHPVPPLETKVHWQTFLWQLSLWTSRGRLQQQITPKQAFTLTQWPNFNLLNEFPHALKLAACLARNSCMPKNIAEKQNVPLPYVYSFLSAANSLGLLKQQAETISQPPQNTVRELLQRMLKRLTAE